MIRVRKLPVEVEAVQYTGRNEDEIVALDPGIYMRGTHAVIPTLEGEMLARPGWWVIQGVAGELYPCDPDVFAKTYEILG